MKITIRYGGHVEKKFEVNSNHINSVEDIKSDIAKNEPMFNMETFCLILNNEIILSDEKMLTFYKIDRNDEICATQLEDYLTSDEMVIVEVFLVRSNPDWMHLIARNSDSIGKLRSIINRIVPEIGLVCSRNDCAIDDNKQVADIHQSGVDHKLIIRCDKIDISYDECCKIYDRYLIWDYWLKYEFFDRWIRGDFYLSNKDRLKVRINQWKSILISDCPLSCELEENLSWIPASFVNSRFLFCEKIASRIYNICEDYLRFVKREIKLEDSKVRNYFFDAIQVSILQCVNNREYCTDKIDRSIRSIIIDAIEYLIDYVTGPCTNGRFWMRLFLDKFLFAPSDNIELEEIVFDSYTLFKLMKNQKEYKALVPFSVKTVLAIKEAVSIQTGVPLQQMYLVKRGGDRKPDDKDNIDIICNYFMEFVGSIDEITKIEFIVKGGFASVSRYYDNVLEKEIILKEQLSNNQDLYRDISIQSLNSSSEVLNRSRLVEKEGNICMTVEYMPGGSLKAYLEKCKFLSDSEISKLSHQILKQIEYLHSRHIIHRDIKSDNIVLDANGNAKVIDLGLAKLNIEKKENELVERLKVYAPGTLCYMAPEILNNEPYTNKIDIWSFGVVVFEMKTGKRPYHDKTELMASQIVAKSRVIQLRPRLRISDELKDFIGSALKSNPNERFSAKDMRKHKFIKIHKNKSININNQ